MHQASAILESRLAFDATVLAAFSFFGYFMT